MVASRENFPLLAELLADQQRLDTPVARFSDAHDSGAQLSALSSQLIPLSKPGPGEQYGFEVDLEGLPPGPVNLVIRTIHPALTNSETGKTMTVSEYDWPVSGRQKVCFGFTFDYRWEIAEGTWTKQIVYNGKVIAEKKFKVVVPIN